MKIKKVLELLVSEFNKNNIHYALIGGFALGVLGVNRSTIDLDFLISKKDLSKLQAIMKKYDYDCILQTENVSQYISNLKIFGEVDFLHAFREISVDMLNHATEHSIFDDAFKIKVLRAEDIIGLKIQAMSNNVNRKALDQHDIESLLSIHNHTIDWNKLKEYFTLFEMQNLYAELEERFRKNVT